jgi:hypothetical protein
VVVLVRAEVGVSCPVEPPRRSRTVVVTWPRRWSPGRVVAAEVVGVGWPGRWRWSPGRVVAAEVVGVANPGEAGPGAAGVEVAVCEPVKA